MDERTLDPAFPSESSKHHVTRDIWQRHRMPKTTVTRKGEGEGPTGTWPRGGCKETHPGDSRLRATWHPASLRLLFRSNTSQPSARHGLTPLHRNWSPQGHLQLGPEKTTADTCPKCLVSSRHSPISCLRCRDCSEYLLSESPPPLPLVP